MKIQIGARKSDLARLQAYEVGRRLSEIDQVTEIQFFFKSSLGDQNQNDPLWQMPEKGVFTQDLTKDLMESRVDLVVHSWKDLPVEDREATEIVATLPRADQRDVLLFRKDRIEQLSQSVVQIFTSSPRRVYNLQSLLPQILPGQPKVEFQDVRGNIQTRVRKLIKSEKVSGLVVAKAALDRLLSSKEEEFKETREFLREALCMCQLMVLPLKENPTAAAQGALAIEIKRHDNDLKSLLKGVNDPETFGLVQKERQILKSYGGGCHQKIGVACIKKPYGELLSLRGKTEAGLVLEEWGLQEAFRIEGPVKEIFPNSMGEARLFESEALNFESKSLPDADVIFLAKESALPQDLNLEAHQILWAPGLRTWKKLAEKGHWVTGCQEALGQDEALGFEALLGQKPRLLKLTHEKAVDWDAEGPAALATYRLVETPLPKGIENKSHYFWTSYSGYLRVVEEFPQVKKSYHACGPGLTHRLITEHLGRPPMLFASYKEWRDALRKES